MCKFNLRYSGNVSSYSDLWVNLRIFSSAKVYVVYLVYFHIQKYIKVYLVQQNKTKTFISGTLCGIMFAIGVTANPSHLHSFLEKVLSAPWCLLMIPLIFVLRAKNSSAHA